MADLTEHAYPSPIFFNNTFNNTKTYNNMAQTATCPELVDVLNENECLENFAGLGTDIYIGLKSELTAPLTATDNSYSTPSFTSGKGLYKVQCADEKQQIKGSSLGRRKGFELTCTFVVDSVNPAAGKLARAINNNDIFIIAKDGDVSQIIYDPNRKVKFDSGAITTDTGAAASDDRITTYEAKLSPVSYPNLYVTEPSEGAGWDSLLASKKA